MQKKVKGFFEEFRKFITRGNVLDMAIGVTYMEKFLTDVKHVEIQLLCDSQGNVVALGERDCSMQRRNQKVIEESPSPLMTEDLRQRMQDAAVKAAKAAGFDNLKGHKSVGGLRASIYNAMPKEGVVALVEFLTNRMSRHTPLHSDKKVQLGRDYP